MLSAARGNVAPIAGMAVRRYGGVRGGAHIATSPDREWVHGAFAAAVHKLLLVRHVLARGHRSEARLHRRHAANVVMMPVRQDNLLDRSAPDLQTTRVRSACGARRRACRGGGVSDQHSGAHLLTALPRVVARKTR